MTITLRLHLISEERAHLRRFFEDVVPPPELLTNDLALGIEVLATLLRRPVAPGESTEVRLADQPAIALVGWLTTLPLVELKSPLPGAHLGRGLAYLLGILKDRLTARGLISPPSYDPSLRVLPPRDRAPDGGFDPLEQGRV